ncbi:MAG: orotate phosphoribosyltransferase [Dehalococcoides mccartyi]|uniref:orotate phosphoribosyltransferase n=1 Tax=Dehalococcoides mccartyi TaxID=61435 RepID=UPI0030F4C548
MEDVETLFEKTGAILKGHFLLTSGLHSPIYWEKFRIIENPEYNQQLCGMIAGHYKDKGIELVAGPTTGGIVLAHEIARQMGLKCVFAEKIADSERGFRRGFVIKPGAKVLVVDDILTTGKSVREVLAAVKKAGGEVAGIGVLVDRSDTALQFNAPVFSCLRSATTTYKPEDCPLCRQGLPLTKHGSS